MSFLSADPEEFLNSLLAQILKAEPFLKLSSGQEAYYYQLFVEKDEQLKLPTVQQLFEQSFLTSDIKLKEVQNANLFYLFYYEKLNLSLNQGHALAELKSKSYSTYFL